MAAPLPMKVSEFSLRAARWGWNRVRLLKHLPANMRGLPSWFRDPGPGRRRLSLRALDDLRYLNELGMLDHMPSRWQPKPSTEEAPPKTAFVTCLDRAFVPGAFTLLVSLKQQHPELDFPFIVVHDGLSDGDKRALRWAYEHVRFHEVNLDDYKGIAAHDRLGVTAYYALEAFRFDEFEQVIFLDADQLCIGPIDELWNTRCTFGACLNIALRLRPKRIPGGKNQLINTGMFVVGSELLGPEVHAELLDMANRNVSSGAKWLDIYCDQRIINLFIKNRDIHYFNLRFNTIKKIDKTFRGRLDLNDVSLLHFTGFKPWSDPKGRPSHEVGYQRLEKVWRDTYVPAWTRFRQEEYEGSGAKTQIVALKQTRKNKRCFILGNGPSLKEDDLSLLADEDVMTTNWFCLHEQVATVNPLFHCICSHTVFGGWGNPEPHLQDDFAAALQRLPSETRIVFSFCFKEVLERERVFPNHELRYLVFEKPQKEFIEKLGRFDVDLDQPLMDGHTGVITFCMWLAFYMGYEEIYLLGCDCDYGEDKKSGSPYFYAKEQHKTLSSSKKHLDSVWREGGPIFECYELVRQEAARRGITIMNATAGGKLEIFPRTRLAEVVGKD